jgi:septal ring factor EnvC (AmiA/AmiB activator)
MKWLVLLMALALGTINLVGQDKETLEQRKESTLKELELARELLDKTRDKKQSTIQRVTILNRGISSREQLIRDIIGEIGLMDQEIDALEKEIKSLERNIKKGKEEYAHILYSVFINHTDEEKMMYLLASEDINEFYQRIKYMKYLKDYRERKVEELADMMAELETRSDELVAARNRQAALLTEKEQENSVLLRERSQRNSMIRQLAQDEQRIRREIEEKERIRKELEDRIRKIIEEETRKNAGNTLLSSLTPEQRLVGNSFLQNKGRLPWPVERGVITTKYGLVNHPVLEGVKIPSNGIDISTPPGTKARAIFNGEVTGVYAILGANYAVILMHGEYITVYQNLVDLKVKAGDKVIAKQELGTIHSDPDENIAVMTLQVWKSKEILDPENWLTK